MMIHEVGKQIPEPEPERLLDYAAEELIPFNDWLDENVKDFPLDKVRYSEVLFEKEYDTYFATYEDDYLPSTEPEPTEEEPDEKVGSAEPKKSVSDVKALVVDFDEETFWTAERQNEVRAFADKAELEFEQLKQIISDFMAFDRYPRTEVLFNAYTGKLRRLQEWAVVREEIMNELLPLMEEFGE